MQPGECFYMYTHERCASLAPYQLPEMHRTPLHELCLQIKLLELGEIEDFLAKARAPTRTRATLTMAMPTRATLTTGHTY